MKDEIEVTLPNGYTIQLFKHEGKVILGLVNPNGFYVSDTRLTETEVMTLKEITKNF